MLETKMNKMVFPWINIHLPSDKTIAKYPDPLATY